ncbi:MAG: ATPase, T2SS/T4P/T4SS family [Gemmatimonadaceae bacterium]
MQTKTPTSRSPVASLAVPDGQGDKRERRQPWADRWLVEALQQTGHPAANQLRPARTAWESLEAAGATTEEILKVACTLSASRPADLAGVGPAHAKLLSPSLARSYEAVAVRMEGPVLEIATSNPLGHNLEVDLAFACGKRMRVTVASPQDIRAAYERIYGESIDLTGKPRLSWVEVKPAGQPAAAPTRGAAVDKLDVIIADALDQRASDIHLEPRDGDLMVRVRVDGVLHEVTRVPAAIAPLLMSRLKIAAGLDIAERRRPQDGRATTVFDGRNIDLRVSTLPLGDRFEKAVIRVLDGNATDFNLGALGFTAAERYRIDQLLGFTEGMLLVTGPTGSGKTTTLYAALHQIRSTQTNLVTVEDPIEYRLEGVNQVQVQDKAGLTFAAALRSILRQDPDVVLVGEIRDAETAGIAIKASMTGHLVLSTLHTNDAPSAVGRLADIGADMSALSGALKGVIAQRLVRRLCAECSVPVAVTELPAEQQMLLTGKRTDKLRKPVGCAACRGTGYRGRMVVPEMLLVTPDIQRAIARRAERSELEDLGRQAGMHTLWVAGLNRALAGQTSLHELLDNISAPTADAATSQAAIDQLVRNLGPKLQAPTGSTPNVAPPGQLARGHAANAGASRVLVVHELRDARRLLRVALEAQGLGVIEAADGESALAYARRLRPDAVVTEVAVPRLDGFGLLQSIRVDSDKAAVFIYTEQTDSALLAWGLELGAVEACTTATDATVFAARVREVLSPRGAVVRAA